MLLKTKERDQNVATGSMGENGYLVQGCALRKIEGSPVLWTCKIQGAQHMICMKNLRFSSRPRAKVRCQGPPGFARAQPCSGTKNSDLSLPQLSVISELPVSCDHKKIWWTGHGLQMVYWKNKCIMCFSVSKGMGQGVRESLLVTFSP